MRRPEDTPLDPEILATLDAIDATLAGEAVEPRYAATAELALLLADERPRPRPAFAEELDTRVGRRFASDTRVTRRTRGWWAGTGAAGLVAACLVLAIAIVAVGSGPKVPRPAPADSASSAATSGASASATSSSTVPSQALSAPETRSSASAGSASAGALGATPTPPANGRKVVQSATLALSTGPRQIDGVAQQVFDVVGTAGGIVDSSTVTQTGGLDGTASFELRVPSAQLEPTLVRLSDLPGATVLSRTDNSQDINSAYVSAQNALADARALRAALLKQLASAQTTTAIDALHRRIASAEATIAADAAALRGLNARIDFSRVSLTINAAPQAAVAPHSSGRFGIGRAAHLAGRVLVVAAGVALIGLAGLLPLALLAAAVATATAAVRRRRREQALDLI